MLHARESAVVTAVSILLHSPILDDLTNLSFGHCQKEFALADNHRLR